MDKKSLFIQKVNKYLPLCILFIGILLRVIYLGEIPGGYHRDEAYCAWNALSLYKDGIDSAGHSYPVYFEAWGHGQNALYSYLLLPLICLNGGHMNTFILRIPQVAISVFSMIAVWLLMKKMFSRIIGNLALFLLAVCPWHVMMSRWGLESNLAPGFLILGLCFWVYGLENSKFFILSALSYGLSLYCYATIWPIVPIMLALQLLYGFYSCKMCADKWLFIAGGILFALAFPLLAFLLVNLDIIPEFKIGCFSVYKMTLFRANELAHSFAEIISNIRNVLYLLWHQDVGRVYDVIMPYGFFYNIGRIFAGVGTVIVVFKTFIGLLRRQFMYETFLLIQLIGAGIVGSLITVSMTQINCLYVPLVLCQAIGICFAIDVLAKMLHRLCNIRNVNFIKSIALIFVIIIYVTELVGFQREYYTDYKYLVSAHFQEGADDAVRYAQEVAQKEHLDVYVNAGLKYPNVLLATETGAAEYLDTLVYSDFRPDPQQFTADGVTFYMGIDFENLSEKEVYVIYYTDIDLFENYKLKKFFDWYVAVPSGVS